ncbi:MAG: phosphoribosylanthranilate isomerase [bacterium]
MLRTGNNNLFYQRTRIKICGLTSLSDALEAVRLGADALGFIFAKESPRLVEPEVVAGITACIPTFITNVGVFKDQDPEWIREVAHLCGLHVIQLHGQESPEYCQSLGLNFIKAFRIKNHDSLSCLKEYDNLSGKTAFLLDTFVPDKAGGTGQTFDWRLALAASECGLKPIILSGGINSQNVGHAIKQVRPFAVDTSSGVETGPGKKDLNKMKAFFKQVYTTDRLLDLEKL